MRAFQSLTREDIYDLVWSMPMVTLAKKLGISDVALKKRCQVRGIPTPPLGYWAKVAAGKPIRKPPLPETWSIERKTRKLPKSADEIRRFEAPRASYETEGLDPRVRRTVKALSSKSLSLDGLKVVRGHGLLSLKVSPSSAERAIWLWSQLLAGIDARGLTMSLSAGSVVSDGSETVTLEVREMLKQCERPYDPKLDGKSYWGEPPETVKLRAPSGFLSIRAEDVYGAGCPREWRDTATPLDEKLERVVDGLVVLLRRKQEIKEERLEWMRQWDEKQRLERQEALEARQEEERMEGLIALALDGHQATMIRNLISNLDLDSGNGRVFQEWAIRVADRLDPRSFVMDCLSRGQDPAVARMESGRGSD